MTCRSEEALVNGLWFIHAMPRWALMWSLAVAMYGLAKATSWSVRKTGCASIGRHAGYLLAWPGMDADAFLGERTGSRPALGEWTLAICELAAGVGILIVVVPLLSGADELLVGFVGMMGIIVTLHFGLFHLLSCFWRQRGRGAVPIMCCPIASRSVTEFWGRRWNRAFRDLTNRWLFRPLVRPLGPAAALMAGFIVSGLIHDVVISLPARGGYGLPTLYFVIQGAALLVERSDWGQAIGLGHGVRGWIFCILVVLVPCGLLFHGPFLRQVMVPFLQALGLYPSCAVCIDEYH